MTKAEKIKANKKYCYYAIKGTLPKAEVKPKATGFIYESQRKNNG